MNASRIMRHYHLLFCSLALAALPPPAGAVDIARFSFDAVRPGYVTVAPDVLYDDARGYGFQLGAQPGAGLPWKFVIAVPEGNYDVAIEFGHPAHASVTTVKAELRRLMLENVVAARGTVSRRNFTVNVRTPQIPAVAGIRAGRVKLSEPRETEREIDAWDDRLTLEFSGVLPHVRSVVITPANTPTVYLLGDSTVCDQRGEPFASWGQMLPRFFEQGVAVANHGQSGETYRGSLANRRIDKIAASLRPGDTVLMQFGHNDQKQLKEGAGGPFTTYKEEIARHVALVRARGGVPVLVSPVERRRFDTAGKVTTTLDDYAEAARQASAEHGIAFIDLHAMSKRFYQALGVDGSKTAFASRGADHLDNTHHSPYGAYQLARFVAHGLRTARLPVARYLSADLGRPDPAHPTPLAEFRVPPSQAFVAERPAGDESNR